MKIYLNFPHILSLTLDFPNSKFWPLQAVVRPLLSPLLPPKKFQFPLNPSLRPLRIPLRDALLFLLSPWRMPPPQKKRSVVIISSSVQKMCPNRNYLNLYLIITVENEIKPHFFVLLVVWNTVSKIAPSNIRKQFLWKISSKPSTVFQSAYV